MQWKIFSLDPTGHLAALDLGPLSPGNHVFLWGLWPFCLLLPFASLAALWSPFYCLCLLFKTHWLLSVGCSLDFASPVNLISTETSITLSVLWLLSSNLHSTPECQTQRSESINLESPLTVFQSNALNSKSFGALHSSTGAPRPRQTRSQAAAVIPLPLHSPHRHQPQGLLTSLPKRFSLPFGFHHFLSYHHLTMPELVFLHPFDLTFPRSVQLCSLHRSGLLPLLKNLHGFTFLFEDPNSYYGPRAPVCCHPELLSIFMLYLLSMPQPSVCLLYVVCMLRAPSYHRTFAHVIPASGIAPLIFCLLLLLGMLGSHWLLSPLKHSFPQLPGLLSADSWVFSQVLPSSERHCLVQGYDSLMWRPKAPGLVPPLGTFMVSVRSSRAPWEPGWALRCCLPSVQYSVPYSLASVIPKNAPLVVLHSEFLS